MSSRYYVVTKPGTDRNLRLLILDDHVGRLVCEPFTSADARRIADLLNQAEVERKHELMAESVPAVPYPGDEKEGS